MNKFIFFLVYFITLIGGAIVIEVLCDFLPEPYNGLASFVAGIIWGVEFTFLAIEKYDDKFGW